MNSIKLMLISLLSLYAVGCGSPFTAEEEMPIKLVAPDVAPDTKTAVEAGVVEEDAGAVNTRDTGTAPANDSAADAAPSDDGSYVYMADAFVPPPPTVGDRGCSPGGAEPAKIIVMTQLGTISLGPSPYVCVAYYGSVDGWSAYNLTGRGLVVNATFDGGSTEMGLPSGQTEFVNQSGLSPEADGYTYWNWSPNTTDMVVDPNSTITIY